MVGLQRVAEPVDDEELDAIDGSAAEGDDDIAPEADTDDDIAEDEESIVRGKCSGRAGYFPGPFALTLRQSRFTATLTAFC